MKNDLQEKLEKLTVPMIELESHRQSLRRALLSEKRFQPQAPLAWLKNLAPTKLGLAPVIALVLLTLVFGSNFIYGQVVQARAMEIIKNDPAVKKLNIDFAAARVSFKRLAPVADADVKSGINTEKHERAVLELQNNGMVYSLTVNLTHREVEDIREEARERIEERIQEDESDSTAKKEPLRLIAPDKEKPRNSVKPTSDRDRELDNPLLERLRSAIATSTNFWPEGGGRESESMKNDQPETSGDMEPSDFIGSDGERESVEPMGEIRDNLISEPKEIRREREENRNDDEREIQRSPDEDRKNEDNRQDSGSFGSDDDRERN